MPAVQLRTATPISSTVAMAVPNRTKVRPRMMVLDRVLPFRLTRPPFWEPAPVSVCGLICTFIRLPQARLCVLKTVSL
jgi:hypothetical protein